MTISIDMHVSYALQYYSFFPTNQLVATIYFHPGVLGFDNDTIVRYVSGVGIDPINPDEPNEIFATIEDAIKHYKDDKAASVISDINTTSNEEYIWSGNLIYTDAFNQALLDEKQPLDGTLTDLSGVSTTTFGRSILGTINAAGARTLIGAGTSNFDGAYTSLTGTPALAAVATSGDYSDLSNKPSIPKVYSGTTLKSNPVLYCSSATVSSGTAVFHLTTDGTSSGTALFPSGPITTSLNCFVSDSAASYQMAGVWSNSNKTLTVTTNKLGTANILTGILGQVAGNGAVVNVQVWGN